MIDNHIDYRIFNIEILEGPLVNIEKIISFTHTYVCEVINNESVIASVCEEVYPKYSKQKTYNLIIGTARESINEYIKLEKSPIKKYLIS